MLQDVTALIYLAELYRKQGLHQKAVVTYEKFFSISTKADPEIDALFYSAKLNQLIAMYKTGQTVTCKEYCKNFLGEAD